MHVLGKESGSCMCVLLFGYDTVALAAVVGVSAERAFCPVLGRASQNLCSIQATCQICGQVRGATAHFDAVVGAATSGVLGAAADSGVPVVFCVMTTDTMEQARSPRATWSVSCTVSRCSVCECACIRHGGDAGYVANIGYLAVDSMAAVLVQVPDPYLPSKTLTLRRSGRTSKVAPHTAYASIPVHHPPMCKLQTSS